MLRWLLAGSTRWQSEQSRPHNKPTLCSWCRRDINKCQLMLGYLSGQTKYIFNKCQTTISFVKHRKCHPITVEQIIEIRFYETNFKMILKLFIWSNCNFFFIINRTFFESIQNIKMHNCLLLTLLHQVFTIYFEQIFFSKKRFRSKIGYCNIFQHSSLNCTVRTE